MNNNVYKNYIFDFYGTLVDILTDEKDPTLWDKLAQLYQAYGAYYKGKALKKSLCQARGSGSQGPSDSKRSCLSRN